MDISLDEPSSELRFLRSILSLSEQSVQILLAGTLTRVRIILVSVSAPTQPEKTTDGQDARVRDLVVAA